MGLQPSKLTVAPNEWDQLQRQLNYLIKDIYSYIDELKGVDDKTPIVYSTSQFESDITVGGDITVVGTVDGVDIAARDAILTTAYAHSQVAGGNSVHVSTAENTQWDTAYSHSQIAGGNSVHVSTAENTAWDAAVAHVSATGASHSYIDQAVLTNSTVKFDNIYAGGRPWFDVRHYGALGDDANDDVDKNAIQDAIDAAEAVGGGTVFLPEGIYRIRETTTNGAETKSLTCDSHITIQGAGYGTHPTDGGTWFHHVNAAEGDPNDTAFHLFDVGDSEVHFKDFAVDQDQPAAGGGWAAWVYGYIFDITGAYDDVKVTNVYVKRCYDLLKLDGGGRLFIDGLWGQPLHRGIVIDNSNDVDRINNVHFWPYWSSDSNVTNWTTANLYGIQLIEVDNPQFSNIFIDFALRAIYMGESTHTPQAFQFNNVLIEYSKWGLFIDGTNLAGAAGSATYPAKGMFNNTYFHGGDITDGIGVEITSAGNAALAGGKLQFSNCRWDKYDKNCILASMTGWEITISNWWFEDWGGGGAHKAIYIADGVEVWLSPNGIITDTHSRGLTGISGTTGIFNYVDLTPAEITQLQAIGATTISATQWGYLGAMDQGVATGDTPTFTKVITTNGADLYGAQIKLGYTASGDVLDAGANDTYLKARNAGNVYTQIPSGTTLSTLDSNGDLTITGHYADGTCEIYTEDALTIIQDMMKPGSKKFDKYGHEHFNMKKLHPKYPSIILRKKWGKKKHIKYFQDIGATNDLLFRATMQLDERLQLLEAA